MPTGDEELRRGVSDDLRKRGFEAGNEPVYSAQSAFELNDFVDSLISGEATHPRVLVATTGTDRTIPFVVGRLEKVFIPLVPNEFYPIPDWRFEGWLVDGGFSPKPHEFTVRGYVENGPSGFELIEIQVVPTDPSPDGVIEYVN